MPASDIRPTADDVAVLLKSRTRDDLGNLVGTFTDETTPTLEDVEAIIDTALALEGPALGKVPEALAEQARAIVKLRAVILVELSVDQAEDTSAGGIVQEYREALAEARSAYADAGKANTPTDVRIASVGAFTALSAPSS